MGFCVCIADTIHLLNYEFVTMSEKEIESKYQDVGIGENTALEKPSNGTTEIYIDPVKEAKMMRKFDVCSPP